MRQLAAALEAQAVELAEANQRKNQFIAVLSHELRNPLAPLVADLEIIKMTGPTGVIAESVERMKRQVGHIIRMIDDLLDMSRIRQNKVKLDHQRVDLVELLKQCREMMHAQFDRMGHRLVLDLPERTVYAEIDPTRISQAINNLLSNASKFTENGGQVRVSLGLEREQAVIRVKDNGHGIAPEQLKTIFEMFVQLDGSGESRTEGLGIGLSLAKQLVELHGGSIAAYSEGFGKGAEFVIRLPLPDDQKQRADAGDVARNLSHAEVASFWQRSEGYPHSMRAEYRGDALRIRPPPRVKDSR
jgi:signal transduction histidine kinase